VEKQTILWMLPQYSMGSKWCSDEDCGPGSSHLCGYA